MEKAAPYIVGVLALIMGFGLLNQYQHGEDLNPVNALFGRADGASSFRGAGYQHRARVQSMVVAARTDDGYVNHQSGSAPPTAHPCVKLINGQEVHGRCW